MKKTTLQILGALAVVALSALSAHAADAYYDNNGATAGSGNSSANWSTSVADWTYDATGSSATANWNNGDSAIFSAGSDQTSQINVTTTSALTVSNITQNLGRIRILSGTGGGTLTLSGTSITISNKSNASGDYDLRVDPVIADSGSGTTVTKNGPGVLLIESANTFTGGFVLNNGSVGMESSGSFNAFGTGTVTVNSGNIEKSWGNGSTLTVPNALYVPGTLNLAVVQGAQGNLVFGGNVTGGGNITVSNINLGGALTTVGSTIFIAGDISGFTGTFKQTPGNNRLRFGPTSGSGSIVIDGSNAKFFTYGSTSSGNPIDMPDAYYGTLQMGELSGTGGIIRGGWASTGNTTFEIGALNTSTTYAGAVQDNPNGSAGLSIVKKVGTGTLTLSGPNTYSGGSFLSNGVVNLGIVQNGTASGPLGKSGNIAFAGGTMQYSSVNQFDYSPRIASSTGPISIDVNGTNVTFATAIAASNTGGLALTNSTGTGKLTLTAANSYTGNTTISAGTLVLSGSGSVPAGIISVGSAGTFDVSAVSFILGGSQTLSGSGTVTGAVTTASVGSSITPGGAGSVGTLTFKNNLDLSSGASPVFDLSTSRLSGNDQTVVSGNLTLGIADTIHISALSGASNLDQTGDYTLFSVAGTTTMTTQPGLAFDGTAPANASHYSVQKSGNNVVLHYSATTSPTITFVTVTNTVDGTTNAVRGQSVTVFATVSPGAGTITNVSANLSSIGGSVSQALTSLGGNNYSYTTTVSASATLGADLIGVTVKDTTPSTGSGSATLMVNASNETWSGLGANDNWSSGANWVSTFPPGYSGDALIFTGSTRTTPNMENNYSVAGLTFDGSASSFTLGATAGKTLTLAGGVTNSSGNPQTLNLPVVLSGAQTIEDQGSAGIILPGVVSGSGLNVNAGNVTLAGANTYTGNTTISAGTLKVGNSAAIPSGSGVGNVSVAGSATLDLNGTNATINGLTGVSGAQIVNNGASASTLDVGANDQAGSWNGYMSGALSLIKVGTNTLTLLGANGNSGGVTLNAGSLVYENGSAFGSGTLTLAGGNLVKTGGNIIVANPVNVTGTVNFAGTAGGNPEFTGALTGSGTLAVSNLPVGGIAVQATSLVFSGDLSGFTGTFSHTTTGGSPNGGNRLRLSGASLGQVTINCANARLMTFGSTSIGNPVDLGDNTYGTLQLGELSGTGGIIRGGWASSGNTIFEVGALNTSATYSGSIQDNPNGSFGLSGVTKVGTGTLTLNGPNSYSGPTTVSNGTLNVYSTKTGAGDFTVADGATLGVTSVSAGSLKVSSLTLGSGAGCTNSFNGVSSTSSAMITNAGALTLNGTVVVNIQGVLSVGQYPLIGSTNITGTGGFVLGSVPPGTGANIGTNGNTIVLNVMTAPAAQLWTGSVNTNWDFATINWSLGGSPGLYTDSLSATFDDTSSRTNVNLATNVTPVTLIVTNNTKNYTFSSANSSKITGSTAVTKTGNGTLTLLGLNNDFTGGFAINSGTVAIDGDSNLGGGTVDLQGTLAPVQSMTITKAIGVGPVSGSGNGTVSVGSGLTLTNNGVMANYGSGAGTLIKNGSGTLQLDAANTYSGGTVVSNGTLVLATGGQTGAIRGNLTVNSGATAICAIGNALGWGTGTRVEQAYISGLLQNTDTNDQGWNLTYNLTGGELRANGGVASTNLDDSRFVLGDTCGVNTFASAASSIISGQLDLRADGGLTSAVFNIADGAAATDLLVSAAVVQKNGTVGITKTGAGTMLLASTNTYTGTTVVSNGTLLVNGSISGAADVEGGVLGGTGTISGAVTVNGGTLAPGTSAIGTLTVNNNLALNANTQVKLQKGLAQSNDVVNVSGTLTYGGTLTVNNLGSALVAGDSFRIFPTGGTGSVTVSGSAGAGLQFSFADGLLSVVTAGPSGPGTITNSVTGSTLNLTWPTGQGWRLVSQTNSLSTGLSPTGWSTVSGVSDGSAAISIDTTKPTVFYRLVYP